MCYSRVTSRDSPKWRACSRAFFKVARETGSVSCRSALWDCFEDGLVITRLCRRLGREFLYPKTAPWCNSTQHRPSPTHSLTCPPARTRIVWCYGREEIINETTIFLALIGIPFRYEPLCYTKKLQLIAKRDLALLKKKRFPTLSVCDFVDFFLILGRRTGAEALQDKCDYERSAWSRLTRTSVFFH